jgi:hypothetical protein
MQVGLAKEDIKFAEDNNILDSIIMASFIYKSESHVSWRRLCKTISPRDQLASSYQRTNYRMSHSFT